MSASSRITLAILFAFLFCQLILLGGCSEDNPVEVPVPDDGKTISIARFRWRPASPPVDPDENGIARFYNLHERFFWYNIEPNFGTTTRDLDPTIAPGISMLITTLDIELDTMSVDVEAWAGIMTGFEGCGLDLSAYSYLEIWINDFKPDPEDRGGILYIDIGRIDEDFFEPNENHFDDEDKNKDGFTALTEDTGLDGLFNKDGDTSDDDYSVERDEYGRFTHINGTEGNYLHDTEDLNRSGVLETENCYLEYTVALADTALQDIRRDYPTYIGFSNPGHEYDSWRKYAIELSSGKKLDANCWSQCDVLKTVQHIRIWFRNVGEVVDPAIRRLQIAFLRFTE